MKRPRELPSRAPNQQVSLLRAALGAGHLASSSLLLNAISVFAVAYIIRGLGSAAYGQWSTATAIVTFLSVGTNLGLRGAFVREVARHADRPDQLVAEQLGFRLSLSAVVAPASVVFSMMMGYPSVVVQCTAVAAFGMILSVFGTTFADALQATHRLSLAATGNFIGGLVLTIVSVASIAAGAGPVGLSCAYLIGPAVTALVLARTATQHICRVSIALNLRRLARALREARYFGAQVLVSAVGGSAASLVLPKLVTSAEFGYFAAGSTIASRLGVIPDSLSAAYYPLFADAVLRDPAHAPRLILRSLWVAIGTCTAVAVGVVASADSAARLLFPGQEHAAAFVIKTTILALPLSAVSVVIGHALYAAGREARVARITTVSTVAELLCTVWLCTTWGLVGAAWSLPVRYAISVALLVPDALVLLLSGVMPHGRNAA